MVANPNGLGPAGKRGHPNQGGGSRKGDLHMPVLFIEAPPGIRPEKKRVMMQKITEAVDEAYHIGDTLIFLREYPVENVAMDGRIQSENLKIREAMKQISAGA
jgi:hypothetical protein